MLAESLDKERTPLRSRLGAAWAWLSRAGSSLAGLVSLLVGLSIVSSLPVVQLLALGYLLAAGAEMVRSGSLARALAGLELWARVGALAAGAWILMWIPRALASLADSARLIEPGSERAGRLEALALGVALLLCLHLVAAVARGAKLRHVLLPRPRVEVRALRRTLTRAGYVRARDMLWDFASGVHELGLLRLAVFGLLTGIVWLTVPTTLLALGAERPLLAVLGCLSLAWVVAHLPFLQLHVAVEGRLEAIMDVAAIRERCARAPLATSAALACTVLAALPLYLLKIELIPREALWLPGLLFVAFMLPARLVCGWALHYARTRPAPRGKALRGLGWMLRASVVMLYAVSLYFTQYLSWYGTWSLYEQHAFLLPVPFLGL